jgi:predicted TIM-barrel fold metal-dependent hydrolase
MAGFKVISSDNHCFEPADLWTSRGEHSKFGDRLPRVINLGGNERIGQAVTGTTGEDAVSKGDWWFVDGHKTMGAFAGTQTGLRFEEPEKLSMEGSMDDVRPGGYIPEEHVKDMDIDGIDHAIIYPTVGLLLFSIQDTDLVSSMFRTYNDWIGEFCNTNPARLRGIAMVNVDDVEAGVKELERCAKTGAFAGAMITVYPPDERQYDLPMYEPLWAAAQANGMPLSLHIGTNRPGPGQEFQDLDTASHTFMANVDHWVRMSIGHMIFNGVFERYPKLQVGSVEMEISWVPHFLDRIDYNYTQRGVGVAGSYRFKEGALPSDYFHSNIFCGFQEDALGVRDREIIGINNLMWGNDYPHQESTFPKSREIIDELFSECTQEEKAKIVGGNAARIYGLDW